ncbi:recombinase family protein [Streptomyces sp. SID3343]|uniref:recombinase family protein n=1 Tax=Streptomyces sp. SID3343 TaxID=2690260 RepID=UPI0013692E77|nr:recombinase family protein [Streptomyces sp. SID3343]MYW03868.1 recombinase family protein [Streptomyces sp. SID3343]
MPKPKRVGIYVRISRDRKGQELGIQRQEKACRELCERRGWTVVKVYPENDVSASITSKKRRPQYAEMMRDVREGTIDGIVVYSIDRLTRRIAELTNFLEAQKEHSFEFATTEGEDTSSASGRMILTIKGAVAQQETERMSERVNASLLQRREKGQPHAGGPRVFGFEPGSAFQRLVPEEVEWIQQGYRLLLNGKTPGDVARLWNAAGARTTGTGTEWTIQKVKRVYRSERVGGIVTYKGSDIGDSEHPHPLTREQWENVQSVLDARMTPVAQGSGKRTHVYTGFLHCGYCKSVMRVQWTTVESRTFRRVFCHSGAISNSAGKLGCGKINRQYGWVSDRLDEVVEAALLKRRPKHVQAAKTEDLSGEIAIMEQRIRALRQRWKDDGMEDEDYFDALGHLRAELQTFRQREATSVVAKSRNIVDALTVWRDESPDNIERRRAIVATVIEKVELYSVGRGRRKPPDIDSIKITPVGDKKASG